jgi:ribonuclease-3
MKPLGIKELFDKKKLNQLESKVGHVFKNKALLLESMSHSSFVNERKEPSLKSNERLEFLGDSVLGLAISKRLHRDGKKDDEGQLSRKRAALVREATLAILARKLRLQQYLFFGHGEKKDGGGKRDSVLSDALEALIGALFLDAGWLFVERFILSLYQTLLKNVSDLEKTFNFKSQLMEYAGKKKKNLEFRLKSESGPEHQKKFTISVYFSEKYLSYGTGSSIKKAEQTASKNALKRFQIH